MCGRFALHASAEVVALQFGLDATPSLSPHFNIAPGAEVLLLRGGGAALARWGLVPSWARDPATGAKMINARAETISQKPAFRDAYRRRRCLIPASGFYEWRSEGGRKQPYYVFPAAGELFAFAGIWERRADLESCAIVTTGANAAMVPIHDRMPVILAPADYVPWLEGAEGLLRPCPAGAIALRRVGRAVNDARNDSAALIQPAPR